MADRTDDWFLAENPRAMRAPAGVSRDHKAILPVYDLDPGASASVKYSPDRDVRIGAIAARSVAQPPDLRSFQAGVGGSKRRGRRASWLWSAALLSHYRERPPALASLDSLAVTSGTPPSSTTREHMLGSLPLEVISGMQSLPIEIVVRDTESVCVRITNREEHRKVSCTVAMYGARL